MKNMSFYTYYVYNCIYKRKDNYEVKRVIKIQSYYSVHDLFYTLLSLFPHGFDDLDVSIEYEGDTIEFNYLDYIGEYLSLFDDSYIDHIKITMNFVFDGESHEVVFNCDKIDEIIETKRISRKTPIILEIQGHEILSYENNKFNQKLYNELEDSKYKNIFSKERYYYLDNLYDVKLAQNDIKAWFTFYKDSFEYVNDNEIEDYNEGFNEKIIDYCEEDEVEDRIAALVNNLASMYNNQHKDHIQKYHTTRKLVYEVLSIMNNEVQNNLEHYINQYKLYFYNNVKYFSNKLNNTAIEYNVLFKSLVFFNIVNNESLVNKYIRTKRFKKEDKIKMLNALSNYQVGIYKISNIDKDNAYVTLKDIKTNKEIIIIDEGLVNSYHILKDKDLYLCCLSITYEDITFNEISVPIVNENKEINEFINLYKDNLLNDFEVIINGTLLDYNNQDNNDNNNHKC